MTTNKEKLTSEIKSILKEKYDVKTLREIINPSSSAAVKDLVKKNPNIDLKTLKKSLSGAGHGGYQTINQPDLDAVKTQLGIQVAPAQPKASKKKAPVAAESIQPNQNAQAAANTGRVAGATARAVAPNASATNLQAPATQAPATSAPGAPQPQQAAVGAVAPPAATQQSDNKIEKQEIDAAKELIQYVQYLPQSYVAETNKTIASFNIPNVNDIQSAEKFLYDHDSVLGHMEDFKGLIHVLIEFTNKEKYPSPKPAQPQAGAAGSGQQPQVAQGQPLAR